MLIALEGIDGAGTSTQLVRVAAALQAQGRTVTTTREPSDGAIGSLVRKALRKREAMTDATMALLFAADRLHHIESVIAPALARGEVVLTDRYLYSSLAYQGALLPQAWVQEINSRARAADLSILLSVSTVTAAKRRVVRGVTAERFESDDVLAQVARTYAALFYEAAFGRTAVVDGEEDETQVTRAVIEAVEAVHAL